MTWVLTLILIHYDGVSMSAVPGFASQAECQRIGEAWLARANRRAEDFDVPLYRCRAREPKPER